MKTKIFSYYLQKLAQMEQELLGVKDQRAALLAVILAKTNLFRRLHTGCTVQPICMCFPRYAQELFLYMCIEAKKKGTDILSYFNFAQKTAYIPGLWGQPYVEDADITSFLTKVYPEVLSVNEIDINLYRYFFEKENKEELIEKFIHLGNFRQVNEKALRPLGTCKEKKMIDDAFELLKDNTILCNMLSLVNKCDIYGKSPAYLFNLKNSALFS